MRGFGMSGVFRWILLLIVMVLVSVVSVLPGRAAPPVRVTINPAALSPGQTGTVTTAFTNTNAAASTANVLVQADVSWVDSGETKTAGASCGLTINYPGGPPWSNLTMNPVVPTGVAIDWNSVAYGGAAVNPRVVQKDGRSVFACDNLPAGTTWTVTYNVKAL